MPSVLARKQSLKSHGRLPIGDDWRLAESIPLTDDDSFGGDSSGTVLSEMIVKNSLVAAFHLAQCRLR